MKRNLQEPKNIEQNSEFSMDLPQTQSGCLKTTCVCSRDDIITNAMLINYYELQDKSLIDHFSNITYCNNWILYPSPDTSTRFKNMFMYTQCIFCGRKHNLFLHITPDGKILNKTIMLLVDAIIKNSAIHIQKKNT